MRAQPDSFPSFNDVGGDGGVVQQAELIVVAWVRGEEVGFVLPEAEGEGGEDLRGEKVEFPVEGCHEGTEVREGVGGEPDVGLLGVEVGADFVAFLRRC